MVQIQTLAPDFSASALFPNSKEISSLKLSNYRGRWVVLFFYPLGFSKLCTSEIVSLSNHFQEFQSLGCDVIAASCDSVYAHLSYCSTPRTEGGLGEITFPLISDYNKEIATRYGILLSDGVPLRASFLIGPDGVLRHQSVDDLPVARSVRSLLRTVKAHVLAREGGEREEEENIEPESSEEMEREGEGLGLRQRKQVEPSPLPPPSSSPTSPSSLSSSLTRLSSTIASSSHSLLTSYLSLIRSHPLLTKSVTSCLVSLIGEVLGSLVKLRASNLKRTREGLPPLSLPLSQVLQWRRLLAFASFGLLITGPIFHFWYSFLERLVSLLALPSSSPPAILLKLLLDRLVLTPPFLALTLSFLQLVQTLSPSQSLAHMKRIYFAALITNWKVWTPAQALNLSVVPLDLRVLFGNLVALWWNIYLSSVN